MAARNFDDPKWKSIRWACFKRDEFKCCLCNSKGVKINCHHILRVADHPELEFVLGNLITLCTKCHTLVTGRESLYEQQFREMILFKKRQNIKFNKKVPRGQKWRPRNIHLRF